MTEADLSDLSHVPEFDPNRPVVWFERGLGAWGYRPSALGQCLRSLVACRKGDTGCRPTEAEQDVANEGHLHEPDIAQKTVREYEKTRGGKWAILRNVKVYLELIPGVFTGGHSDGILYRVEDGIIVEILGFDGKAQGINTFQNTLSNGISDVYKMQQSIYWHGLERRLGRPMGGFVYACKNRNSARMAFHERTGRPVHSLDELAARVLSIEARAEMPGLAPCADQVSYCSWRHLHDYGRKVAGDNKWRAGIAELAKRVKTIEAEMEELGPKPEIAKKLKLLKREKDNIRAVLLDQMQDIQRGISVTAGAYRVDMRQSRDEFDMPAMIERMTELEAEIGQVSREVARSEVGKYRRPGSRWVAVYGSADGIHAGEEEG